MRKFLSICAATAFATPAFAFDSGDAAFKLLSQHPTEISKPNFVKLQSSIDMPTAMAIDAELSKLYGAATTSREGLKVWEVENKGRGAKQTTIMCGPDGKGGLFISADRRGPSSLGAASRNQARTQTATQRRARTNRQPITPKDVTLERD